MATSKVFLVKIWRIFFLKFQKIHLLDSPALFFRRQVAKIRPKTKKQTLCGAVKSLPIMLGKKHDPTRSGIMGKG